MNEEYNWIKELPKEYKAVKEIMYEMPAKKDKTIRQHTDDLLVRAKRLKELGYVSENIFRLLYLACEYHDIGKANEQFKRRIESGGKFNSKLEVVHNILSIVMMPEQKYLTDNEDDFLCILFAVAYHHNYEDDFLGGFLEEEENIRKIENLLLPYSNTFNIRKWKSRRWRNSVRNRVLEDNFVMVKGLLHKCDYAASGNYEIEYENSFLKNDMGRLLDRWQKESGLASDNAKYPRWNEMQLFCEENTDENIMVTAQTGMGKTEASLLWLGNHKAFYILPVRTAINAMYDRIRKDVLENKDVEQRLSLLHSNTLERYLSDKEIDDKNVIEYSRRGRNLSMPITISTLDQLFDFVYRYQGYELKLATLAYSKIVIDEIQMYEPQLLAYLVFGVELITGLGGKVAIMTATLPPYIFDLFKKINFKYREYQSDLLRHNVAVKNEKLNTDDIADKFLSNKAKGKANKILVICNCVKKAQKVYKELLDKIENGSEFVHLLHSKFIKKDRSYKESQITECGKDYEVRNEIWVSTSLVEASLDIDFDYLFTELQDLNSLFQRFGRCNRRGLKSVDEVNCYVYTKIDSTLIRYRDDKKSSGFIDEDIYRMSVEAVNDTEMGLDGIVTEKHKTDLLKKYFTSENMRGSNFMHDYKDAYKRLEGLAPYKVEKSDVSFRNIHNIDIIPHDIFLKNKEYILELESCLKDKDIPYLEKKKAESSIRQYTVSIYRWEYTIYTKALKAGRADMYPTIRINNYEEIPVMECKYNEELGYERIDFENRVAEALFW